MKASRWRLPISSSPSNMNLMLIGSAAGHGEERPRHLDRDQHRTLVVGHAASVEPSVAQRRRPRVAEPLVQRVRRLHVVVAVDEHRRLARRAEPLAVHHGIAGGRDRADREGTGGAEASATQRAARSMSAACAGSVLTLGIAANCTSASRIRSRSASRWASTRGVHRHLPPSMASTWPVIQPA